MIVSSQGLAPLSTKNPAHPCAYSSVSTNRYKNGDKTFALRVATRYVWDDLGLVSKVQTVQRFDAGVDAIIGPEHEVDITGESFDPEQQARQQALIFNFTRGAA